MIADRFFSDHSDRNDQIDTRLKAKFPKFKHVIVAQKALGPGGGGGGASIHRGHGDVLLIRVYFLEPFPKPGVWFGNFLRFTPKQDVHFGNFPPKQGIVLTFS